MTIMNMHYDKAMAIVEAEGNDTFLETIQAKYPEMELYTFSTAWQTDRNFGCKVKGAKGDLLIRWNTNDDVADDNECPRCLEPLADGGVATRNSICRTDNKTVICNSCGVEQAFKEWRV